MLLSNAYDAAPDAMNCPHLRCVTCGGSDAPLNVIVYSETEPRRQTIPLAAHKGRCDQQLEAAAGRRYSSWEDADDFVRYLKNNTDDPPKIGVERDGTTLLRLVHYPVDLRWTAEILERLNSPLTQ